MKKYFRNFKFFALFCFLVIPTIAFSNGFQINEQGAKALGMGGAFVAQADDPTAVYFNPAGITQLDRTQVSFGVSPIMPYASFKSDNTGKTTDADENTFLIPNFFAVIKLNERLSLGIGGFSNYGLSTEWPENWEGRYITGGTKAEIVTYTLNPNLAFKISEKLSIAVGLNIQYLDITLENRLAMLPYGGSVIIPSSDGFSKLEGDDFGYGWNVGLHYKITEKWKVGASYRSKIKHNIKEGKATLKLPEGNLLGVGPVDAMTIKQPGSSQLILPDILYLGTSYELGRFTFELDGQLTRWSRYKELAVDFDDPAATDVVKSKDWDDVWAIRFGVQYKVNDMIDLRAGIVRDFSPIPDETLDPLVPSGDRWLYAVGIGLNFENLVVDLAYNYLDSESKRFDNEVGREAPYGVAAPELTGKFKDIYAHIFGINVTYKF